MDELMTVDERAEDERAEDELEVQEAGSTVVLGAEGWEASGFVDPDDDRSLLSDGSYLSPEATCAAGRWWARNRSDRSRR